MSEIRCSRCDSPVSAESRYCSRCGASLTPEGSPAVGSAVASPERLSDSGALEMRDILIEETRGEYEIGDELGRGGMGIVFRANEVLLGRSVAIKVLPPDLTYGKGVAERFRREARTAAALDHPHIIPIYRVGAHGKLFWYAMKYLEGRSLAEILAERGRMSVNETIAILEQVADALDYAHQRSVVHRDIKPHNVMVDERGRVILTDFGIAKDVKTDALTGSGAIIGTPYYMSPEQCRGGHLTGAADQYSVAVMAYQMIAGQVPFDADSAIDVIQKHCQEPAPPVDRDVPGVPKHVVNAIRRGMAKKAADRFPSVTALVKGLKNEAPAEATLILDRPSFGRRISRMVTRRPTSVLDALARTAVALALVGSLVAGSVWLATRTARTEQPAAGPGVPAPPVSGPRPTDSLAGGALPPATREEPSVPSAAPAARWRSTSGASAAASAAAPRTPTPAAGTAKGYLRIRVRPYARITIDDRVIGEQVVYAESLPPGRYRIAFEREGFEPLRKEFVVRAGLETAVNETLVPRRRP